MNRPELQDAFSKTLDTKPRHSYVNHIKQQFQEEEVGNKRVNGSTVNRLSRVFEATHLDKPPLPSKPPILNSLSTEQKPQSIQRPQLPIHTAEIDETQLTFKDLRAKFQQENSIPTKSPQQINYRPPIPLKPSKTGPPLLPEKIILAAKTGPPALPIKPRTNNQKYTEPSHHPLPPLRQYQSSTQQLEPNDALHRASNLASTSASILSIPTMLSRTETGNSSILSTTSTSSQASSFTNSKRGWHISNWFTNQQHQQQRQQNEHLKNSIRRPDSDNSNDEENESAKTVSPQYTADIKPNIIEKRRKVVEELIETEKSYQKDMTLLKDIYYDGACKAGVFSKSDMRHLFSNLINIVEFEKTFVTLLETSCEQDSIGSSFSEMMRTIDSIYSEYCKRHEDAVFKLQELEIQPKVQMFLNECKEQIQGKTTSWDLGSLLIKPVQRVLKYPLLLKEILSLTSTEDKGYNELFAAVKGIQEVADNINEIKRRKDIVEKIVGEKRRTDINVVHGINKKFTRRAQRLKQATGFAVEPTYDSQFETLNSKFEEQQEHIRQFARDVQGWVRHVKTTFENLQQLACSMESFYSSWGGVQVKCLTHISDFNRMASRLSTKLSRELDNNIRGYIYSRIDEFLKVFENPAQVIHKRSMKMIDYDRVRDMKLKGDIPDKALQESADAYVSINAQLVEELPIFFGLTKKFFDILISELALVQIKFYKLMQKEWRNLIEQYLGLQAADSFDEILIHHVQEMDKVEEIASQITILNRNRYAASSRSNSSNSTTMLKQRSKDTYSSSRSINTDNEMTFSSYFGQTSNSFQPTEEPENLINLEDYDTVMVPISTTDDFNCIVLYDFETHEEDVLDVKKGTILRISQDKDFIDPDWWYGTTLDDSRSGWVPINYCKKL